MGVIIGGKFTVRLNISLSDTQEQEVRPATPTIAIGKNPRHSSATGQSTYDILPLSHLLNCFIHFVVTGRVHNGQR